MIARLWAAPFAAHLAAMAVIVTLGVALAGPGVAFFSDEGAVVSQVRLLVDDHSWLYSPPTAAIDPEGAARPFENGDLGEDGLAPYAKHPLYPAFLSQVSRGSAVGAVAVSVFGLVAAAWLAGLLAREIAPASDGLQKATMWAVAVASPLWIASGLVVAHTMAAALAALAGWASLRLLATSRPRRLPVALALAGAVAAACLAAAALRTEALFLGPALAVGAIAAGGWRRAMPWMVGGAALAGSAGARLLDRTWSQAIVGPVVAGPSDNQPPASGSWLVDRLHGAYTTVVQAGYSLSRGQELASWLAVVLVVGGALAWRLRWVSARVAVTISGFGAALYLVRLVVGPTGAIPGLVVACPMLAAAAVLLDRRVLRGLAPRLLVITSGVCVLAILGTQYSNGGGLEWGWRYASFLLPLLVPPVLWGASLVVQNRWESVDVPRAAVAVALMVALLPSLVGLRAQASSHNAVRQVATSMAAVAADASFDGRPPVVLSWNRLLPQILHQVFDDYEWVVPARDQVATYADRLAESGVERVILVGPASGAVVDELGDRGWHPVVAGPGAAYDVVVLEHHPSNVRS